jgi:hypothetical protein
MKNVGFICWVIGALASIAMSAAAFAHPGPHGSGFASGHFASRGAGHAFVGGHFNAPHNPGRAYSMPREPYAKFRGTYLASGAAFNVHRGTPHYARPFPGAGSGWRDGAGHPEFRRPGTGFGHRPWGGGYWHGGFWPRAYYGWGYPWFLPILPAVYATFWFDSIPYYYVDDIYYTWSPDYSGYVVTDPPPTEGSVPAETNDGSLQSGGAAGLYVYPKNGQSEEQTSTDRYECHKWASGQTGFDPTRAAGSQPAASSYDYRRAMLACLDARGYSVK